MEALSPLRISSTDSKLGTVVHSITDAGESVTEGTAVSDSAAKMVAEVGEKRSYEKFLEESKSTSQYVSDAMLTS